MSAGCLKCSFDGPAKDLVAPSFGFEPQDLAASLEPQIASTGFVAPTAVVTDTSETELRNLLATLTGLPWWILILVGLLLAQFFKGK